MGVFRLPNKKNKEYFLLILCMHTPIHTDKHTLQSCLHNNYLCLFFSFAVSKLSKVSILHRNIKTFVLWYWSFFLFSIYCTVCVVLF